MMQIPRFCSVARTGLTSRRVATAMIAAVLCGGASNAHANTLLSPFGFSPVEPSGQALYEARCGGCHALDKNKYGPKHRGVFGRLAGTQPGYRYSDALKRSGIVWTAETLDRWMEDPRRIVPGARMDARLKDPEERRLIIEYLRADGSPSEAPRR
jgi:cytochrome c